MNKVVPSNNIDENCSICLSDITTEEQINKNQEIIKQLNCGHNFHTECINEWTKLNNTCPICRAIIRQYSIQITTENNNTNRYNNFIIPEIDLNQQNQQNQQRHRLYQQFFTKKTNAIVFLILYIFVIGGYSTILELTSVFIENFKEENDNTTTTIQPITQMRNNTNINDKTNLYYNIDRMVYILMMAIYIILLIMIYVRMIFKHKMTTVFVSTTIIAFCVNIYYIFIILNLLEKIRVYILDNNKFDKYSEYAKNYNNYLATTLILIAFYVMSNVQVIMNYIKIN